MIGARAIGKLALCAALALGPVVSLPTVGYTQDLAGPRSTAYSRAFSDAGGAGVVQVQSGENQRSISLAAGKSIIVELPVDARDVLVSSPSTVDAVLRTPRRIYLLGLRSGVSDAIFFDANGRRILSLGIQVGVDTGGLSDTLSRLIPGARIRAEAVNGSIILSGEVPNALAADQAVRLATSYASRNVVNNTSNDTSSVINMMTIAGKDQVMLKVRIVEVQRTVIKQLGFDLSTVYNQVGEPQYLLGSAATFGVNGSLLGGISAGFNLDTTKQPESILVDPVTGQATDIHVVDRNYPLSTVADTAGDPGLNKASSMLKAFERVGLVRTLAEPNLTALSGESAKFLAGGEYPVPSGLDTNGRVSVEFKPYGVGLGFTPVVLSGGRISLRLATEVSELTTTGGFTIGSGTSSSLSIPALNVRRAESTVELPSGGSMMIAGLLQESSRQAIDSMPGMMNLPVIGALLRSRDYQHGETELVIIVTPYLVKATSPGQMQTPADGLRIADDLETTLLGRLNKTNGTRAAAVQGRTYQGPYGYVIE